MKEKIILAPGVSSSELLRTLAKYGVNTMGLRVVSSTELAKFALMKSGISMTEEFLTHAEEPSVIYSFLNEISYFSTASYADAENLALTLQQIRMLIADIEDAVDPGTFEAECERAMDIAAGNPDCFNESFMLSRILGNGEFPEKNEALFTVYRRYMQSCSQSDKTDTVGLIRKAYRHAKAFGDNYEFLVIKEFRIQPAERSLLDKISGGNYREISLTEVFGIETGTLKEMNITEGYGEINEVESIIDDIYSGGKSLDKCLIACAGSGYSQLFYDLSRQHNIPMTFGSGVPISNSNPARLLKLMYEWNTSGYNGIDALRKLLTSEALDRKELFKFIMETESPERKDVEKLIKFAGSLRISMDSVENYRKIQNAENLTGETELLKQAKALAHELESGMSGFIGKYSLIRPEPAGRLDQSAVNVITTTLNAYTGYASKGDINEIIPELLSKTVCSENSREGTLHISSIQAAMSCMRENLYVCGLSASNFPGSPSENYLMLDNDYRLFDELSEEELPLSENRIRDRKRSLDNLLVFAASLGAEIQLSYSGYSLSELKEQNPSSVLFNLSERIDPDITMEQFRCGIKKAPYFSAAVDDSRLAGDEYSKGSEIDFEKYEAEKISADKALEMRWSPSALELYSQCPRHFYLSRILKIPELEPDDPFMVLSPADVGTIAHSMMEELAAHEMDRAAFIEAAGAAFDEALVLRPPMHTSDAKQARKEFLQMMEKAYDADPHNAVLSAETEYSFEHPSGIRLHGYPDRVETTADGKFIIADFKTKRKVEHLKDDFVTCLQVVIYAWMCEQAGIDISSCEYRYLRKGKSVSCKYDDTKREELDAFLRTFRQSIENNDFPRNETKASCRYCKMADICK